MTWQYRRSDGMLSQDSVFAGYGYSGHGIGKNNPDMQSVPNVGCIPAGAWIIGPAYTDPEKGPIVMRLSPEPDTETYGRTGFLIHGDSIKAPGTASEGCIILSRAIRQQISDSDDNDLMVV